MLFLTLEFFPLWEQTLHQYFFLLQHQSELIDTAAFFFTLILFHILRKCNKDKNKDYFLQQIFLGIFGLQARDKTLIFILKVLTLYKNNVILKQCGIFHIVTVDCFAWFFFFSNGRVKMVCHFGLETSFCKS